MSLEDYKVEEFEHKGYTIAIYADTDTPNPREDFDHAAEMVSLDAQFGLDRSATGTEADALDRGLLARWYAMQRAHTLLFHLADYGSSGWNLTQTDDEQHANGFLLLTSECIQHEQLTDPQATLEAEYNEFKQYLAGEVYGYVITDHKGEHVDSCWGFYGLDYCRAEARSVADALREQSYWRGLATTHPS